MARSRSIPALAAGLALFAGATGTVRGDPGPRDVFPQPPLASGHYLHIPGIAFRPLAPTPVRQSARGVSLICPDGAPFSFLEAWFSPPHGARLELVQFNGRDNSSQQNQSMFLFRVCHNPVGAPGSAATATILGAAATGGTSDYYQVAITPSGTEIVDAFQCRYLLRVQLTAQGVACLGENMILDRALVAYEVLP